MRVKRQFDKEKVAEIAKSCGADSVKDSISYISIPFICEGKGFVCEIFDDVAFFAGTMCKKHFRLYEMAVSKDAQKGGYGRGMITRMRQICQQKGVEKITCRTSKEETAIEFYRKVGGVVVGEKGNDYEVEIKV